LRAFRACGASRTGLSRLAGRTSFALDARLTFRPGWTRIAFLSAQAIGAGLALGARIALLALRPARPDAAFEAALAGLSLFAALAGSALLSDEPLRSRRAWSPILAVDAILRQRPLFDRLQPLVKWRKRGLDAGSEERSEFRGVKLHR
jgi:hypothetical protein